MPVVALILFLAFTRCQQKLVRQTFLMMNTSLWGLLRTFVVVAAAVEKMPQIGVIARGAFLCGRLCSGRGETGATREIEACELRGRGSKLYKMNRLNEGIRHQPLLSLCSFFRLLSFPLVCRHRDLCIPRLLCGAIASKPAE